MCCVAIALVFDQFGHFGHSKLTLCLTHPSSPPHSSSLSHRHRLVCCCLCIVLGASERSVSALQSGPPSALHVDPAPMQPSQRSSAGPSACKNDEIGCDRNTNNHSWSNTRALAIRKLDPVRAKTCILHGRGACGAVGDTQTRKACFAARLIRSALGRPCTFAKC